MAADDEEEEEEAEEEEDAEEAEEEEEAEEAEEEEEELLLPVEADPPPPPLVLALLTAVEAPSEGVVSDVVSGLSLGGWLGFDSGGGDVACAVLSEKTTRENKKTKNERRLIRVK